MKRLKLISLMAILASMLVFASACGNGNSENSSGSEQNKSNDQSESSEKTVDIDGSSTVAPIMKGVTEAFTKEHSNITAPIAVSGSGGGFKRFVKGETDLSNASRPIKPEEKQKAEANDVKYKELKLAYDGLSVVVNTENDWVDKLTVDQLKTIWKEGGATTWKDVNPEWPDEPIKFFSPGTSSGTFDYFTETILGEDPIRREGVTFSENDNTLVQGVTGNKNGIGYFGYAYYYENKDQLRVIPIVNPDTGKAVKPKGETIQSGAYAPLSRPLFTYVNQASLKNEEQVYQYVKFMLNHAAGMAKDVGYVALPDEKYQSQLKEINNIAGK